MADHSYPAAPGRSIPIQPVSCIDRFGTSIMWASLVYNVLDRG